MPNFLFLLKEMWKGKSLIRAYLNFYLSPVELKGKIIDIGGGKGKEYLSFMQLKEDSSFETFDIKNGQQVDFEKDSLPADDDSYDSVLFLNVMEHIFNYQHIANEVIRIVKKEGQLVGYVPFFMWYHPDHRDFFRYTHESIEIIFKKAGAKDIEIIPNYCGPFIAATQMMILQFPRIIRPIVLLPGYLLDKLFFVVKRSNESKYILGYLFVCKK